MVESLRRAGQQVEQTVLRQQSNRELKAFGQEAQSLNPQSPNYQASMLGLMGKYPMAANSKAGQNIMSALGSMNRNYLGEQNAQADFNRNVALENLRSRNRITEYGKRPNTAGNIRYAQGIGLYDPVTGEVVEASPEKTYNLPEGSRLVGADGKVLAEAAPRTTATPYRFGGGVVGNAATGEFSALPQTQAQLRQAGNAEAKFRLDAVSRELNGLIQERKATQDLARAADIDRAIDQKRLQLREIEAMAMDFVPTNRGSVLGGINPMPLNVADPLNQPVPADALQPPSVLPAPAELPPPAPKKSTKSWKTLYP